MRCGRLSTTCSTSSVLLFTRKWKCCNAMTKSEQMQKSRAIQSMLKQGLRTVLLAVLLVCSSCEQRPLAFVVDASTLLLGLQPDESL